MTALEKQWQEERTLNQHLKQLQGSRDQLRKEMDIAQRHGNLSKTAEIQYGELPKVEQSIKHTEEMMRHNAMLKTQVDDKEISITISANTGIPVTQLLSEDKERILNLGEQLKKRVIGQEEAINAVCNTVRRSFAGLSDPNRPRGSFLFLGTTGVGKTELCRSLAEALFDTKEHFLKLDMSEFMEAHSVSRLLGAPPGYVGFEEGGMLTEAIRRYPYSIVLFDEIEKAHCDVANILLQILEDGRLSDHLGHIVDFKNTWVILTSNLVVDKQNSAELIKSLRRYFRPELINRIDDIITFNPITLNILEEIVHTQINYVAQKLEHKKLMLEVTSEAISMIAQQNSDPMFGARPIRRAVQREIENPIASLILHEELQEGDIIQIDVQPNNKQLSIKATKH